MGSKVEMQMPLTNGQSVIEWAKDDATAQNDLSAESEACYGPAKSQVYDVEEADPEFNFTFSGVTNETLSRVPQGANQEVVRKILIAAEEGNAHSSKEFPYTLPEGGHAAENGDKDCEEDPVVEAPF